jgi:hypothetical protein
VNKTNDIFFPIIIVVLFVIVFLLAIIVSLLRSILEMVKPEPQTGVVKGNVIYGDSTLIEGVLLTLSQNDTTCDSVLTGKSGEFEFNPMAIGVYTLTAHKDLPDGWLSYTGEVALNAPEITLTDLPLVKPGGASKNFR